MCRLCAGSLATTIVLGTAGVEIRTRGKEEVDKDDSVKEKCKSSVADISHWKVAAKQDIKSLKWITRHAVVSAPPGVFDLSLLPIELLEYVSEARGCYCKKCKNSMVQYMDSTTKCSYFDKSLDSSSSAQPPACASQSSLSQPINKLRIIDSLPWEQWGRLTEENVQQSRLICSLIHATGCVYVLYDCSKSLSFVAAMEICKLVQQIRVDQMIVLVGTKIDKPRDVQPKENIQQWCEEQDVVFAGEFNVHSCNFLSDEIFRLFLDRIIEIRLLHQPPATLLSIVRAHTASLPTCCVV